MNNNKAICVLVYVCVCVTVCKGEREKKEHIKIFRSDEVHMT